MMIKAKMAKEAIVRVSNRPGALAKVTKSLADQAISIDAVIATRCIESGYDLLHSDKDFDPFAKHLGLRVVG